MNTKLAPLTAIHARNVLGRCVSREVGFRVLHATYAETSNFDTFKDLVVCLVNA